MYEYVRTVQYITYCTVLLHYVLRIIKIRVYSYTASTVLYFINITSICVPLEFEFLETVALIFVDNLIPRHSSQSSASRWMSQTILRTSKRDHLH